MWRTPTQAKKDIVLCYLDFKGAFPSTDHKHLVRTLEYLGLPDDFTLLISNLYSGTSTEFITPTDVPPRWVLEEAPYKETLSPLSYSIS